MAQVQRLPLRRAFASGVCLRCRSIALSAFHSGRAGFGFCSLLRRARCADMRWVAPPAPTSPAMRHPFLCACDPGGCARGTRFCRTRVVSAGRGRAAVRWQRPLARRAFFGRGVGRCIAGGHDRFLLAAVRASGTRTLASVYGREKRAGVTTFSRTIFRARPLARGTALAPQAHDAIEHRLISAAVALRGTEPRPEAR